MSKSFPFRGKVLGVIIPGARPDNTYESREYEVYRYDDWMRSHEVQGARAVFEVTVSEGSHVPDTAFATGRADLLQEAGTRLAEAGCNALAWACTCASFVGGLEWARGQAARLAEATGLPATSTSLALLAAIRSLGADTVDVLSPYPKELTAALEKFLHEANVEVAAMATLGCPGPVESHELDLRSEAACFHDRLPGREHPLVIPDTAIDTISLIPALEADMGRPVIGATQATLWQGLKLLGIRYREDNGGVLWSC